MIDYEFFRGRQNEIVVKELCVASAAASETFCFKSPYKMADHGSSENGLNWSDKHIEYKELHTVITEALAVFAQLYDYGVFIYTFRAGLTGRPIHILEDLNCPAPASFIHRHWCRLPCHKFPRFACATKTAYTLYDWLMYYLQKKDFVQCSTDMTRNTVEFVPAV